MITEQQRRALFALREALRLCEEAGVSTQTLGDNVLVGSDFGTFKGVSAGPFLNSDDVDRLLAEHPEP